MLIAEHKHRGRHDRRSLFLRSFLLPARRAGVGVLIAVGLFLAKHLLLFEILRVHLVGEFAIMLIALIVGRARIPPPRVDSGVPPRIAVTITPAAIAVAVIAESEVAEAAVAESALAEVGTAEFIVQKGTA